MDIFPYLFFGFFAAVVLFALYFLARRNEKANEDPITQLTKNLQTCMREIKELKEMKSAPSKIEMFEFYETFRKVAKDHLEMRERLDKAVTEFNYTVMQLRMIKAMRNIEKKLKEIDQ